MTNQEVFDMVVEYLLSARRRSVDPDGNCLYRGPEGSKCAVGCLITDEAYAKHIGPAKANSFGVHDGAVVAALADSGVDDSDDMLSLLSSLQLAHDGEGNWNSSGFVGYARLATVAKLRGLALPAALQEKLSGSA